MIHFTTKIFHYFITYLQRYEIKKVVLAIFWSPKVLIFQEGQTALQKV